MLPDYSHVPVIHLFKILSIFKWIAINKSFKITELCYLSVLKLHKTTLIIDRFAWFRRFGFAYPDYNDSTVIM